MDPNQQNPFIAPDQGVPQPQPSVSQPLPPAPAVEQPPQVAPLPQQQVPQPSAQVAPAPQQPIQPQQPAPAPVFGAPQQPANQPPMNPTPGYGYGESPQQPAPGYAAYNTPLPASGKSSKKLIIILGSVFFGFVLLAIIGFSLLVAFSGGLSKEARFRNVVSQTEAVDGVSMTVDVPARYKKIDKGSLADTVTWGVSAGSNKDSKDEYVAQEFLTASKSEILTKEEATAVEQVFKTNTDGKTAFEGTIKETYKKTIEDEKICTDVVVQSPTLTTLAGTDVAFAFTFTCKAPSDIAGLGTQFTGKLAVGFVADKAMVGMGVIVPKTIYDKDEDAINKAFDSFKMN